MIPQYYYECDNADNWAKTGFYKCHLKKMKLNTITNFKLLCNDWSFHEKVNLSYLIQKYVFIGILNTAALFGQENVCLKTKLSHRIEIHSMLDLYVILVSTINCEVLLYDILFYKKRKRKKKCKKWCLIYRLEYEVLGPIHDPA